MKKRILALALAGTTAFSVFGAAMSASADEISTHVLQDNDAYLSYTPVAQAINVGKSTSYSETGRYLDYYADASNPVAFELTTDGNVKDFDKNATKYASLKDYAAKKYDSVSEYEYVLDANSYTITIKDYYYQEEGTTTGTKFSALTNVTEGSNGSDTVKADGKTYRLDSQDPVVRTYTFSFDETTGVQVDVAGDVTYTKDVTTASTSMAGVKIQITPAKNDHAWNYVLDDVSYNGDTATVVKAIADGMSVKYEADSEQNSIWQIVEQYKDTASSATVDALNDGTKTKNGLDDSINNIVAKIKAETTGTDTGVAGTITVDYKERNDIGLYTIGKIINWTDRSNDYTEWTYSAQSVDADVEPYELKSSINAKGEIVTYAYEDPTVYAYDFIYVNNTSYPSYISSYWNNKKLAETVASILPYNYNGTGYTLVAEKGAGTSSVRKSVISDWEDFLDELGINHTGKNYAETWDQFKKNYVDLWYADAKYDVDTGKLDHYEYADLYGLTQLLEDIYALSTAYASEDYDQVTTGYYNANTSELVYLMQQYDKYFDGYVTRTEVDTDDEWGKLLLSVLESAEEADFKKASDYKKYMNKVDDLRDAFEDATTVGQVEAAEQGMYDLLTDTIFTSSNTYSDSRSDLNNALKGLFFNVKSARPTYTTAPSTQGTADYTNYNYLVAVSKPKSLTWSSYEYEFTTTRAAGYYSLYPMDDYIDWDTTTPNTNYVGNASATDFNGYYATEEYEWFWNVYQLAYNMYASTNNQYSGALNAVNEALAEAVDNLAVTTTVSNTAVSALDEMVEHYEDELGVESDYNEGYYAKYQQALDYAEVAEGKYQVATARYIVETAGEALTYQGTQITVTKNDIKSVSASIKEGETALKAIKESADYNAAQVNALNKAIAAANDLVALYNGEYSTLASAQSVNKTYSRKVGDKDQMLKSDVEKVIADINAAIDYSEIVMGWSKNDAGKWMYGTEDGYLSNGWNKIGSVWYYFNEDGTAKQSEWMQLDGNWYWFNSNAGAAIGWAKVDGQWYYFGGNNAMKTGWQKVDDSWYYLASSGRMVTGWVQVGGKWYYMSKESNSLGQMLSNTTVEGYKLGADGAMIEK